MKAKITLNFLIITTLVLNALTSTTLASITTDHFVEDDDDDDGRITQEKEMVGDFRLNYSEDGKQLIKTCKGFYEFKRASGTFSSSKKKGVALTWTFTCKF